MWVYVRTSRNFAYLASFHAIESVGRSVVKMLDIFVCQTSENKGFKMKHSVTDVHEERVHDLISYPVSTLSARST